MTVKNHEVSQSLLGQLDMLAELVTDQQYRQSPDLIERYGESGRHRWKNEAIYHIQYLSDSILLGSPRLFLSYISWLRDMKNGLDYHVEDLTIHLSCLKQTLLKNTDELIMGDLSLYLDFPLEQREADKLFQAEKSTRTELTQIAEKYTAELLKGRRNEAEQIIRELIEQKIPIQELYLSIFQYSQYKIGWLWQTNQITVAQEHFCTAATQFIMSQFYPYLFSSASPRNGLTMVAACAGEELHELGLRMISDFYELEGWDTYYLGANVPADDLVAMLIDTKADLLCISATMTYHIKLVKNTISTIRDHPECSNVKVLAGGLPFNIDKDLITYVGADGYARNAEEAVKIGTELVSNKLPQP